jgi:hypothetical protein
MLKQIFVLVVQLWVADLVWCKQKATPQDLQALQHSTNPSDTHLVRALAQQAREDLGRQSYRNTVREEIASLPAADIALNDIAAQAQKSEKTYDTGDLILKGNDLLIKGSIAHLLLQFCSGCPIHLRR